jgi:hypothetical protein
MTIERNTAKRAVYQANRRAIEKARKKFGGSIEGLLNGRLHLYEYVEDGEKRHRVRIREEDEAASCHWLAKLLESWEEAGFKWSRWPYREKFQADYVPALTDSGDWPRVTIERRPIEGDLPKVPLEGAPELSEEEIHEILSGREEEDGWHRALRYFFPYMTTPAFDSVRRCDRPACGRYFVIEDRSHEKFCSSKCAKDENRRKSTSRTRAHDRQRMLAIVQEEINRLSSKSFTAQSVFLERWRRWEKGIAEEAKRSLVLAGLDPIKSNSITIAVRISELKAPLWKEPVDK